MNFVLLSSESSKISLKSKIANFLTVKPPTALLYDIAKSLTGHPYIADFPPNIQVVLLGGSIMQ